MRKILFLDYDGVLNCATSMWRFDYEKKESYELKPGEQGGMFGIEPDRVRMLADIVESLDVHVVVSSSWRIGRGWKEVLVHAGMPESRIIDSTCSLGKKENGDWSIRGDEIKAWLDENPDVEKYAILDDSSDMLEEQMPYFFETSWTVGLTQEIADNLRAYFSPRLIHS